MATTGRKRKSANGADTASIEAQIAEIRKDVAGLADAIGEYRSRKLRSYRAAASNAPGYVMASARGALRATGSELSEVDSRMKRNVANRPYETIGLALGIGVAAGLLFAARSTAFYAPHDKE